MLACAITAASTRDEWGALDPLAGRTPRLRLLRADAGYPGALASWAGRVLGCDVEIVQRDPDQKRFVVVKGRWVPGAASGSERTFGWLGRSRRLSKDYEERPESERAMVLWSMTQLMLRRLHPG